MTEAQPGDDLTAGVAVDDTLDVGLPRRFGRNLVAGYWVPVVQALSLVLVTPVLLRHLGDRNFGIWSLAGSVILYLELLELGMGVATVKQVAEDAYKRPAVVIRTVNTNLFLLLAMGVVALIVGSIVAAVSPTLFSIPPSQATETRIVFVLLAASLCLAMPGDAFGGALSAHARYDLLAYTSILQTALVGVLSVVVVVLGGGIVGLAVVATSVSFSMHVVRFGFLRRIVPGMRVDPRLIERRSVRQTARLSGWLTLRALADLVNLRVDLVIVGALLGPRDVTIYAIGSKLAQALTKGIRPMSILMLPEASTRFSESGPASVRRLLVTGTRATLLVGMPAGLVLALLAHPIVDAWVGPRYDESALVLIVLAGTLACRAATLTAENVIVGMGHARPSALIQGGEALVNLALSIAFGYWIGPVGVAFGTLAGFVLVNLPGFAVATSRAMEVPMRRLAAETVVPHALATAVTGGVLLAVRPLVSGIVTVGAASIGAFLLYVAVYMARGASPAERAALGRIWRRLRSRRIGADTVSSS